MKPLRCRHRTWAWLWRLACVAALSAAMAGLAQADDPMDWQIRADEPRAFGHQVGDVVVRRIAIEVPAGRSLDLGSLPPVGRRGKSLELRELRWDEPGAFGGRRHTLTLSYQVFLAPTAVRTLELPPVKLRFGGGARTEDVRIDAWPLVVAPLSPAEVSPRNGLGELRPEAPALPLDTTPALQRLAMWALLAAAALAYLAQVYLIAPAWAARHRPFAAADAALRRLGSGDAIAQRQQAYRCLHRAIDRTAGEVVFETSLERLLAAHPRFVPLQSELREFFRRSRTEFFGEPPADQPEAIAWLRQLCRRCRDLERGAA